jgi:hypothetical protein
MVLAVGLTIAQLAVILALRVMLPILFHLLAIVFGRGMREAASRMEEAGKAAGEALRRAKEAVSGAEDDAPRIRVVPVAEDADRSRIAAQDLDDDDLDGPEEARGREPRRPRVGD